MGRFRIGLILGFGLGYVFGTKAGRERYEQMRRGWERVRSSPAVQRVSGKAGAAIGLGLERGKLVALDRFDKVKGRVRERRAAH